MGLDMYLTRKKYVGAEYAFREVTGEINIKIGGKVLPVNFDKVSYIEESAMYWRKANAIHKWFVDNVQKGKDDCGTYWVSVEKLYELQRVCKQVLANKTKASTLLPTQDGFFFGGTQYDEWYFGDIERTVKELEELLRDESNNNVNGIYSDFYYHSSW